MPTPSPTPTPEALSLTTLATEFYNLSRPVGLVVALEQVLQLAVDAFRYYAAYGQIASKARPGAFEDQSAPAVFGDIGAAANTGLIGNPPGPAVAAGSDTVITLGEWAIIKPLFVLYVERENAIHLEATRGLGADPYGRSVSEVTADITLAEETAQTRAFFFPIFTV